MSQTLTDAEQQQLQQAFDAIIEQVSHLTGVLGLACVVITKGQGPVTAYAGEYDFLAPAIELLSNRLEEVEIVKDIDALVQTVDNKVH